MAKRRKRHVRHCSVCRSTHHDARYHRGQTRRATRTNPIQGDLVAIEYDPHDGDKRPYRHEAGDVGFGIKRKPAKVYTDPRTGKVRLIGDMRWVKGRGLVG